MFVIELLHAAFPNDHAFAEAQSAHSGAHEGDALATWLKQGEMQVSAHKREGNRRRAGTGADIDELLVWWNTFGEDKRVEAEDLKEGFRSSGSDEIGSRSPRRDEVCKVQQSATQFSGRLGGQTLAERIQVVRVVVAVEGRHRRRAPALLRADDFNDCLAALKLCQRGRKFGATLLAETHPVPEV